MARSRTPNSSGDTGYPHLEFKPEPQRSRYVQIRDQMVRAGIPVETDPSNFGQSWMFSVEEETIFIQKAGLRRANGAGVHADGRVTLVSGMALIYPELSVGEYPVEAVLEWLDTPPANTHTEMMADLQLRCRFNPTDGPRFLPEVGVSSVRGSARKRTCIARVDAAREIISLAPEEEDVLVEETGMGADDRSGAAEMVHASVILQEPVDFRTLLVPWNDLGRVLERTDPVDRVDFSLRLGTVVTPSGFIIEEDYPPNETYVAHQVMSLSGTFQGQTVFGLRSRPGPRIDSDIGTGMDIDDALKSTYIGSGYSATFSKQLDYHRTPAGDAVILRQSLRELLSCVLREGLPAPASPPSLHRADEPDFAMYTHDVGLNLGMWSTREGLNYDYVRDALGRDPVRTSTFLTLDLP